MSRNAPARRASRTRSFSSWSLAELSAPAATPLVRNCATWSRISAIQRRDHHGEPFTHRGQEAGSTWTCRTGGHHRKHVVTCQHGGDDLVLSGAEIRIAEGLAHAGAGGIERRGRIKGKRRHGDWDKENCPPAKRGAGS